VVQVGHRNTVVAVALVDTVPPQALAAVAVLLKQL
jgi:hypothetical protein